MYLIDFKKIKKYLVCRYNEIYFHYFRNFFFAEGQAGKMNQHQVIFLKDVEPEEMESLLQFIYLGEVDIPGAGLERLIAVSKELGIRGLDAVKKEVTEKEAAALVVDRRQTRKKSKTPPAPESPKRAKIDNVSIYDGDVGDHQDPFDADEYVDEDYPVAESDVRGLEHENDSGMDDDTENNELAPQKASQEVPMSQGGVPISQGGVPMSQAKRGRPLGKRWSAIWDHFSVSETDPKYAICVHCGRSISRGSVEPSKQSLFGMKSHFNRLHKEESMAMAEKPQTETRIVWG